MSGPTLFWIAVWAIYASIALLYIRAELQRPPRRRSGRADRRNW